MPENYLQKTAETPDANFEQSLRPTDFGEFTGQAKVVERLLLSVEAAKGRGDTLAHILLFGPPGLGKTTLAHILAQAMDSNIHCTSGPQIEKAGDLAGLLTKLAPSDVLFIDEIHRLHPTIEEYLYPAMEDFRLDIIIDTGANARSLQLHLPNFTLIGATTRSGLLTAPLRSRFGLTCRLDYYQADDLKKIIIRSAAILNVPIDPAGAAEIASRSRGTPRIANALLRWTRDYAQVRADNHITQPVADAALQMIEIDADGLDEMDKRYLETLTQKFDGGPVGLDSLAVALSEDAATLEDVNEPYLIMQGFVQRTPRGRVANPAAYTKLGLPTPIKKKSGQQELFD